MKVVERGLARCPRCVAIAEYTFVESGPNVVRYEVNCSRCGHCYSEVHTATAPDFSAAVDAPAQSDVGRIVRPRRLRMDAWLASGRTIRDWPMRLRRRSGVS